MASLASSYNWLVGQSLPQPKGSDHPNIVPYGTIFDTADGGRIVLAVGTDRQFTLSVMCWGRGSLRIWANADQYIGARRSAIAEKLIAEWPQQELCSLILAQFQPDPSMNAAGTLTATTAPLTSEDETQSQTLVATGPPAHLVSPTLDADRLAIQRELVAESKGESV